MKKAAVFVAVLAMSVSIHGQELYEMAHDGVVSRSISFENLSGFLGEGGRTPNHMGAGRKGSPQHILMPGSTVTLCNIEGSGVIRHIWLTLRNDPSILQGVVLEAYWDGQEHPSVSAPVGPFFGIMLGRVAAYESAVHSVNPKAGVNIWLPMPFHQSARIVLRNESPGGTPIFYNIDYTLNDSLSNDVGCLHAVYRRENPTMLREDFVLMPERRGRGRFLGAMVGMNAPDPAWPGEGEFKFYMDGDTEFPTICGTGTEDWIGQSWGFQNINYLYGGCPLNDGAARQNAYYRWHMKDPVYWQEQGKATMQQIGHRGELFERQDDMHSCSFWYEPLPSAELPALPGYEARIAPPWKLVAKGAAVNGPEPGLDDRLGVEVPPAQDGVVEAEAMKTENKSGAFDVLPQRWGRHFKDRWSGDQQMFFKFGSAGESVDLLFEAKAVEKDIVLQAVKAPDYGICEISLNGRVVAEHLDLFNADGVVLIQQPIGKQKFIAGTNRLTIRCVGRNEHSKGFRAGLDCLK